jgi:vancomycin resistance protein VanW
MQLQKNKTVNIQLAIPKIDKIVIQPGEMFSFWELV